MILLSANVSKSQIKALTDSGKEVLLFDNGTWKYSSDSISVGEDKTDSITTNPHLYSKTPKQTFLVKSSNFNIGIHIDPSKWTFVTHKDNEKIPESQFRLKSNDDFAMMITETTPISLEGVRQIALLNAQKASLDAKEVHAEYRTVNNKKIFCLTLQGTVRGIKLSYLGYYYSNDNGTIQVVCYSTQKIFEKVKPEFEMFLNGLVELEN